MKKYIFKRLLLLFPTALGVITVVFFLVHLVPGDPVDFMFKDVSGVIDKAQLRKFYNLDKPILSQFMIYLKNIVSLDCSLLSLLIDWLLTT